MHYDQIADALAGAGLIALPGWLADDQRCALLDLAQRRSADEQLRPARIGQGDALRSLPEVRGDRIQWLDAERDGAAATAYLARMHALRDALNQRLFLGLMDFEAHFAHYPPGARYARHLDRFRSDDARTLSTVLYLGAHWQAGDGGELRIYPRASGEAAQDLAPLPGLLVLFLSAEIEHEVLPTRVDRYSIAGWMRRRSQQ